MILKWKEGDRQWTEELTKDSIGNPWGMYIQTGPWLFTGKGLPLPWWYPGHYSIKFSGNPIYGFNVWGVIIDSELSDKYLAISTENGVDVVKNPLTVTYNITDVPNVNLSSVTLRIYDNTGTEIRTVSLPVALELQTTTWDGKDDSGQIVIPGEYALVIEAEGEGGKTGSEKHGVTVVKVELGFQNSKMSSPKVIDPLDPPKNVRIGLIREDSITFKAILTPDVTLEDEEYNWTGEKNGTGAEISITFNNTGNRNEILTVLGVTKTAATTVLYVPPPNETSWGLTHLWLVPTILSLKEEAENWVNANVDSLGGGLHNGRADAARHAYWSVLMAIEIGATNAEGAATSHERTNIEKGDAHNEIVMDMENNAAGRIIAIGLPSDYSRTVCQNAVINALNAGTLTILDDLTNSNEVGLLQPSDE